MAGECVLRSMGISLGITLSSIVTICERTLVIRKGPSVQPNNLLSVPAAKDYASPSFAAVNGVWKQMSCRAAWIIMFHIQDYCIRVCASAGIFYSVHSSLLLVVCKCKTLVTNAVIFGTFCYRHPSERRYRCVRAWVHVDVYKGRGCMVSALYCCWLGCNTHLLGVVRGSPFLLSLFDKVSKASEVYHVLFFFLVIDLCGKCRSFVVLDTKLGT